MALRDWPRESTLNWTPRQREVLELIAAGLTNGQIAERLGISFAGAKWHVSEVISKLGVSSREEAGEYWRERNSIGARFSRGMSALAGLVTLKAVAAAALGTAAVAAVVIAVMVTARSGTEPLDSVTPDVELLRERESLGMFTSKEAIERAADMVGFDIRLPTESPDGAQLTVVQAWIREAPVGEGLRYATLWYEVELPGSDEPEEISVEQFAHAPGHSVGEEWEAETLAVGSLTVTVYSKTDELAVALFVVRLPGTDEGFDLTAPLALKDQGLELTRAFVAAYEASR